MAIHFKSKHPDRMFECGKEKLAGEQITERIKMVDCVNCLQAIITSRIPEFKPKNPSEFCLDCAHLSITEKRQLEILSLEGVRPPHYCNRFKEQVFHLDIGSKDLLRCGSCRVVNAYEPYVQEDFSI